MARAKFRRSVSGLKKPFSHVGFTLPQSHGVLTAEYCRSVNTERPKKPGLFRARAFNLNPIVPSALDLTLRLGARIKHDPGLRISAHRLEQQDRVKVALTLGVGVALPGRTAAAHQALYQASAPRRIRRLRKIKRCL